MINIYQFDNPYSGREYLYTTDYWFSSNFDSLQQLAEVGYDDPDKEKLEASSRNIHLDPFYSDLQLIAVIEDFDKLLTGYPELFI